MKDSFGTYERLLIVIGQLIAAEQCNEPLQNNVRQLRAKQRRVSHPIHKNFENCNNNKFYFNKNITFTLFTRGIYCILIKNSKLDNVLSFAQKTQI
jgi:hypothetical protein